MSKNKIILCCSTYVFETDHVILFAAANQSRFKPILWVYMLT